MREYTLFKMVVFAFKAVNRQLSTSIFSISLENLFTIFPHFAALNYRDQALCGIVGWEELSQ